MAESLAFMNGSLVPQSEASLAFNDAGFVFGATVTDLCRTFRHRLYRWHDHLARFRESCHAMAVHPPFTDETITVQAHELVQCNTKLIDTNQDLALVLFATPGPIGYYLGGSVDVEVCPTLGMHTFPLPFARYRPWIQEGVSLITPKVRQIPGASIPLHTKHRSRLHYWLAGQEVGTNHQALLLDLTEHVTETASANFLIVKDGTVISPPLDSILPGVSLKVVTELCDRLGIPLVHRPISLEDCYQADEALLTCTTYSLACVRGINGQVLTRFEPVFRRLVEAWSAEVGVNIHEQFLG
ncbi:MAG: hypothetical protein EXR98_05800 [Gemmataceae bacterium]|nr:hypothetical protein [Gemmataceae bacterium]